MKKITYSLMILMFLITLVGCAHVHEYSEEIVPPTCTEDGYTIFTCECGDTYNGNKVSANGHSFSEWDVVKEATEEEKGLKERSCSVCSQKESEEIPMLEHTHKYVDTEYEPTCTEDGYTEYKCECGDSYKEDIIPAAHKEKTISGKPATCTEDGLTDGKKCTVCDEITVEQEVIKATGHTEKVIPGKEPTCTETGLTDGKECDVCGTTLQAQETIKEKGHSLGEWKTVKEPTITETGSRERKCSNCSYTETEELEKLDDPNAAEYTVNYDLNGGFFVGGYTTTQQIGEAFLADFNKYGDGTICLPESFQPDSHPCIKTSLCNSEMLAKYNWLWVYMLADLKEYNAGTTSAYVTDTYTALEKMINGDTTAMNNDSYGPNARTLIRTYMHGVMNNQKGAPADNATFTAYCPDFSDPEVREKMLKNQYSLTATLANGAELPKPVREGYEFGGWEDKHGNVVTTCKANGLHKAVWIEKNPVTQIDISNKTEKISLYETFQLEWTIVPGDAGDQRVKFASSDESIATVDETGLVTTHKVGTVTITIISLSTHGHTDTMTVVVETPGYFDISYETNSYMAIGETIKLNAQYINSKNQAQEVEWSALNAATATVDANGNVTGVTEGVAKVRATLKGNKEVYQDFVVTVLPKDVTDALKVILNAHESNIFIKYNLPIGAGTPNYYADIFGSVSKLLYNQELKIDTTYNKATNEKYGDDLKNRVMESIEFVTVHYTAGFNAGANGAAHGAYFAQPLSQNNTSIHYSTGNDGVFKGLDEQYRAAHAGDDGSSAFVDKFSWIDTPVEVLESDPKFPVVTITENATFAINGRDTGVKVPKESKYNRGYVTDSKWLNDQGIAVNVKDGKYQVGTTWWCYTQIAEGRICSNGGNRNSIGIESAVNYGSDLWYTWQITAQLVADIMDRYNLDITKVKGHHFYSAKDCPQPMLENDQEIWWEFIDIVESEYDKINILDGYKVEFACDSEYINDKGRVVKQGYTSQVITYKVTISKGGQSQTIELASILDGAYNK